MGRRPLRASATLHQSETTGFSWSVVLGVQGANREAVAPVGNDWFQLEQSSLEHSVRLPGRCTNRKRLVSVGAVM